MSIQSDIVVGWIRLDRWGEIDERDEPGDAYATCPLCDGDIDPTNAWLAVVDGRLLGPYCDGCATSE